MHPDLRNNIWINYVELNGAPGVDDDHKGMWMTYVVGTTFQQRQQPDGRHQPRDMTLPRSTVVGSSAPSVGRMRRDELAFYSSVIYIFIDCSNLPVTYERVGE